MTTIYTSNQTLETTPGKGFRFAVHVTGPACLSFSFDMKTTALVLVSLLGVWWSILTLWVVACHRQRVRDATKPMTPEELAECRAIDASIPRYRMRAKDYAIISPFLLPVMLVMLPLYAYGWFLKRSHDTCE